MNRRDIQTLSKLRLREARVLLDNGCYEGAYYLAGYAVECALKSCIAKMVKRYDFPDKKLANDSFSHDFEQLLRAAILKGHHDTEMKTNLLFAKNWSIVREWSEQSRYALPIAQTQAENLYDAIADRRNGVLQWLKKWW